MRPLAAKSVLLSCFCLLSFISIGQSEFAFDFNGCLLSDNSSTISDIIPNTSEECACGVEGDGLSCDGAAVFYRFDNDIIPLFELPEYTLEFSFLGRNSNQVQALFSLMKDCSRDSMIAIQYVPQDDEVEILVSRIIGDSWSTRGAIDLNKCWHQVALTKQNSVYAFYVDNVFIASFDNLQPFPVGPTSMGYLGYSPCVADGSDNTFDGIIDQLRFSPFAKNSIDFVSESLDPDLILNNDTTIVLGETVSIFSGPTCSTSVSWNPQDGISDPSLIEPDITPLESTTYYRTLSHNGCTTFDSIRINTFNQEDLECANLLLPNIFTPNGDNINDTYGISNAFIVEELVSFEIFSRWGELLFSTSDKSTEWDGTYKSSPAMNGMYIYIVNYQCGSELYTSKGSFGLMH